MLPLLSKGILVGLMIYLADYYYNERQSVNHDRTENSEINKASINIITTTKPTPTTTKTTRKPWQSSYQSCGSNMVCVPYQRCPTRRWINELIDYNDTDKLCNYMEICCPSNLILLRNKDVQRPPLIYDPKYCNFTWPQKLNGTKDVEYVQQLSLPWTVSVLEDDFGKRKYICSGALITDRLVLTDSNCFALTIFSSIRIYVIAGEFGSNLLHPQAQERRVSQRINSWGDGHRFPFLSNDITLVVVDRPFILNDDIQPICLPLPKEENQPNFLYRNCLSTAFPATKNAEFLMKSLNERKYELQYRRRFYVEPLNETQCGALPMGIFSHDKNDKLLPSLLCMGRDAGKDRNVCFSEMGAPIVCEVVGEGEEVNKVTYRLIGLGRHSFPCKGMGMPNIVTNVEHFRTWIVKKINENRGLDVYM